MADFAIIFSDRIEDLFFARENSQKNFRFAYDTLMLARIIDRFGSQAVFAKANFIDEETRCLIRDCFSRCYEYSSESELLSLIKKFNSNEIEGIISEEEFYADQSNQESFSAILLPKVEDYKNLYELSPTFASLVGNSPAMQNLRNEIVRFSTFDVSVLILGETGTGKTTIARAIHELSYRRKMPFKSEVLSNSNEAHIESKLFGVSSGGFTGAVERKGLFEETDGGTLFLDEIAEITPNIQTKLLQVLSEGVINRIGSNKDIRVDNRMIFATNAKLELKVKEGFFREDLFYRINDVTIRIPPLRERLEDIPELCREFLKREKIKKEISDSAIKVMQTLNWKGNIRQLEKCIKNAALLYSEGDIIEARDIRI